MTALGILGAILTLIKLVTALIEWFNAHPEAPADIKGRVEKIQRGVALEAAAVQQVHDEMQRRARDVQAP